MKILISCLSFQSYTGSELYVYELAKELAKEHDVDIISNVGGDLVERVSGYGVNCHDIKSPPNFFLGDGEREYKANGETKITIKNKFYKTSNDTQYDLMLLSHPSISKVILDLYDAPALNIIHSEVLPKYEHPLEHKNIKGYIVIRPEIKDYLIKDWGIKEEKIKVVYNPVDTSRFNMVNCNQDGDYILFVGSYDYLRQNTISDLIKYSKEEGKELWLVGRDYPNFVESWVHVFDPTWDVENFTKKCSMVSSVLMGRTVIEGWMCGKTARIYDIDENGDIKGVENVRPQSDIGKFYSNRVVDEILSFE